MTEIRIQTLLAQLSKELDIRELNDVIREVAEMLAWLPLTKLQRNGLRSALNRMRDVQAAAVLQRMRIEGLV